MFTVIVIGGLILVAVLAVLSHWCCYRAGREDGYEQALGDRAEEKRAEQRAARRRTGRHASVQPRRRPESTTLVQDAPPEPIVWVGEDFRAKHDTPRGTAPSHIAASGIAPVILPEPGTYLPQAGRDSGPGTETLARLDLPATTGEMKAITDEYIAQMAIDEEQHRLGLAT